MFYTTVNHINLAYRTVKAVFTWATMWATATGPTRSWHFCFEMFWRFQTHTSNSSTSKCEWDVSQRTPRQNKKCVRAAFNVTQWDAFFVLVCFNCISNNVFFYWCQPIDLFLELILLARLAKFFRAGLKVQRLNSLTLWIAVSVSRVTVRLDVKREHLHWEIDVFITKWVHVPVSICLRQTRSVYTSKVFIK